MVRHLHLTLALAIGCTAPDVQPVQTHATYNIVTNDPNRRALAEAIVANFYDRFDVPYTFHTIDLDVSSDFLNPPERVQPSDSRGRYLRGEKILVEANTDLHALTHELAHALDAAFHPDDYPFLSQSFDLPEHHKGKVEGFAYGASIGPLGIALRLEEPQGTCDKQDLMTRHVAEFLDRTNTHHLFPEISYAPLPPPHTIDVPLRPGDDAFTNNGTRKVSFSDPIQGNFYALRWWSITALKADEALEPDAADGTVLTAAGRLLFDTDDGLRPYFHTSFGSKAFTTEWSSASLAQDDDLIEHYSNSPDITAAIRLDDGSQLLSLAASPHYGGIFFRQVDIVRLSPDGKHLTVLHQQCSTLHHTYGTTALETDPVFLQTNDSVWLLRQGPEGLLLHPLHGPDTERPPRHWIYDRDAAIQDFEAVGWDGFMENPFLWPLPEAD